MAQKNRLAELREAHGWDRRELAEFIGVHERTIYRWEISESQIPDDTKARLCDLFGVSLDYLMGRSNGDNGDGQQAVA